MWASCETTRLNAAGIATERWVLAAAVLASGMAFIDATALNVAMPSIQEQLSATAPQLLWIVNSYALVVAALILLGGALGDRCGQRKTFLCGIGLFALASLACGVAPNTRFLIAARLCQGLGAAVMIPGSLSLISVTFEPARRGRAIGTWSACSVVMTALGPILGGLLAQAGLWRGVFYINLPLAAIAITILTIRTPADGNTTAKQPLDFAGACLSVIGLAALNFGLIEAPTHGWSAPRIVAAFAVGIGSLIAFVWVEQKAAAPLLPLGLFRDRTLAAACLQTICFYSGLFGMTFFLALNLIQVQNYSAALAGAAQLPLMLLVVAVSPLAGRLTDRYGPRWPLAVGGLLGSLGFLALAAPEVTAGPSDYWTSFLPALLLLGLAMGLSAAPLSTAVMNSVKRQQLGIAAGLNSTLSRLAAVLGVAVLGPIALLSFESALIHRAVELKWQPAEIAMLKQESVKLAAAAVPPGLSAEDGQTIERSIKHSFVGAFRLVSVFCAATVGLSTLLTTVLIPREVKN